MAGPGQVIAAPPLQPKVATIMDSAIIINEPGTHWVEGVRFAPYACGGASSYDPCAGDPLPTDSEASVCDPVSFTPFGIVGEDDHSTFGYLARDGRARALQQLEICTPARVEANLWADEAGVGNTSFTSDTADFNDMSAGGTVSYSAHDALIRLIGAISRCGCGHRKMIHATPRVAAAWMFDAGPLIRKEGRVLLTFEDHIVVSGAGYTGTGPGDVVVPDVNYVYATGMVEVRQTAPQQLGRDISEVIDRRANDVDWLITKHAIATWQPSCCWYGIAVDAAED